MAAPRPESALSVPLDATVVAADGGLEHACPRPGRRRRRGRLRLGGAGSGGGCRSRGARIVRHPAAKDATDLELALEEALALLDRILVLASSGGRLLDHLSLTAPRARVAPPPEPASTQRSAARVHVVRGERMVEGEAGELVSLLALHGPAEGVWTEGLAYELRGETLEPGSSRGVSNVLTTNRATVSVEHGVVLAIRPAGKRRDEAPPLLVSLVLLPLQPAAVATRRRPRSSSSRTTRSRSRTT